MNKKITLIGSTGLVGKEVLKQLLSAGHEVSCPSRADREQVLQSSHENIIFCSGENELKLEKISNLVDANVYYLSELIQKQNFEHLTYFSSTRIYGRSLKTSESDDLELSMSDPRLSFSSSKILAESICKFSKKPVLIVRPSNIYGVTTSSKLFLPSITRDAVQKKEINMFVTPDYRKDYIDIFDVADTLIKLIKLEITGTFNIATGVNTSASEIANQIQKQTGCLVNWHPVITQERFHEIDISKIKGIVRDYNPVSVELRLNELIDKFKKILN